jgi:hypothetical protein
MKVQRIGSATALKEAEIALNKALGMKTMSPDLTTRATQALGNIRKLRASFNR